MVRLSAGAWAARHLWDPARAGNGIWRARAMDGGGRLAGSL